MMECVKQEEYPQLQFEAAWALCNVASGTTAQCKTIIDEGGIPLFSKLILSKSIHLAENAIWAIGNIASADVFYRDSIIRSGGLSNLVQLLLHPPEN